MPIAAVIDVGSDDRVVLKSSYAPALVEALKTAIPYAYREWDAASKVWRIDADWGDVLLHTLETLGVTVVDKRPVTCLPAPVPPALSEACTNAYRHPQEGDDFEVRASIGAESVTVDVLDNGTGFAARASPLTTPSPASDGGRGLALMAALTDMAVFDSATRDRGSVHLVKRLRWADDAPFRHR